MSTLHAHIDARSVDCDGPMDYSWVVSFNEAERTEEREAAGVNDFSEIHFMNRVLTGQASPYSTRQLRLTMDDDGFEYHEDTEEGYRQGTVRWCRDEDCDPNERSQRDHYAEAMGY